VKDYQEHLERLRKEAAECALIRDLATDKQKREMFDRICNHLSVLANQIEMAMLERKNPPTTV
jgi:putative hemolysin